MEASGNKKINAAEDKINRLIQKEKPTNFKG